VGFRAALDTVVKREVPNPRWKSNPRTPIGSVEVMLQIFYASPLHGGECSASLSACFTPPKTATGVYCIGGEQGFRVVGMHPENRTPAIQPRATGFHMKILCSLIIFHIK